MTANNSNQTPDDDKALQEQADATWASLESGDPLGQAIRESGESGLPESNPQLRQLLSERLAMVSRESAIDGKSVIGKESKINPAANAENPEVFSRRLAGWGIALSLAFLIGVIAWINKDRPIVAMQNLSRDAGETREDTSITANVNGLIELESGLREKLLRESVANEKVDNFNLKPKGESVASGDGVVEKFPALLEQTTKSELDFSLYKATGNDAGFRAADGDWYRDPDLARTASKIPGQARYRDLRWDSAYELGAVDMRGRIDPDEGLFDESRARSLDLYERRSGGEQYDPIYENAFTTTRGASALSTFSIDVDTASYANMRRFLNAGQRPPPNSVRIEELVNYFHYDYPQPEGDTPFSVNMEVATCPWNTQHRLLRVGLKGMEIHREERPVSNLVFLLDVSGSMGDQMKLPLLKRGLRMMVDQLNENDRVSIVTYAGNAGLVLPATSGDQKARIHAAIDRLNSGGSTNGSAGIQLAYDLASENLIEGGTNRVIWATDGDLNVGVTGDQQLVDLVSGRAAEGVFLTVLGMGTGNLKDGKLEKIANKGNGMYAYIDGMQEARKVLVEQMSGSLVTIAKDVKLQIEFNPGEVSAYRLIGYENRALATEDFDNDLIDAGEIGAGHTVTALYELVPTSVATGPDSATNLKYQSAAEKQAAADVREVKEKAALTDAANSGELLTLALRYKMPESSESTKIDFTIRDSGTGFEEASTDFRFAASVASFGMVLRGSKYRGNSTAATVEEIAVSSLGSDTHGYRAEFIDLVRRVKR